MSELKPELPKRSPAFASSSRSPDPPPSSAARHRISQRQGSGQNGSISPRRSLEGRRSSVLSFGSIDEVTRSLSEDLINPATSRANERRDDEEVTHWHSTPLAFAILPAIGGVLFKNGSAFITDILLLGLAAIFMNWSIRLPWDWYYSAQAQLRGTRTDNDGASDVLETDDIAVESASSAGNSPKQSAQGSPAGEPEAAIVNVEREQAAGELRRQELLALLATFVFPVLAAYLLHTVREQLSSSSTALVSDFNLTIFVLAAEIRPCQQLIRLVSSRTLYLQRIVTGINDPFGGAVEESKVIETLGARVTDLEMKLAEQASQPNVTIAQKAEISESVTAEIKKRCEPRFEALERAMRRYEKRSTTLNMLTEQRLNTHETRIQDSLSLAAVAAQQASHRGVVATVLEGVSSLIVLPIKVAWGVIMWPSHVTNAVYGKLRASLLGPPPAKSGKRIGPGPNGGTRDEKARERLPSRKAPR